MRLETDNVLHTAMSSLVRFGLEIHLVPYFQFPGLVAASGIHGLVQLRRENRGRPPPKTISGPLIE